MKRKTKFQEGGEVEMTAAERRRQNMQRINQRRATNRERATSQAEVRDFNERMRQGNMTPEAMRSAGGTPTPQAGGGGSGAGGGGGGRGGAMVPSGGQGGPSMRSENLPATQSPRNMMRQALPSGGGMGRPRVVGGAGPTAAAGVALGLGSEALRRYMENRGNRPITGSFEQGMEPEGTNEAADMERARQTPAPRAEAQPSTPPSRPRAGGSRGLSEADKLNEIVLRLQRGEKPTTETEKRLADAMGIAYRKGGMVKPKGHNMREEGMEMKGGRYRGGMQEEMAEMMPARKKPAAPMMKKGGAVKAPAKKMKSGGKVAPKKASRSFVKEMERMYPGGATITPTKKPKKMMGGGKAMYAKGGMTRGCK